VAGERPRTRRLGAFRDRARHRHDRREPGGPGRAHRRLERRIQGVRQGRSAARARRGALGHLGSRREQPGASPASAGPGGGGCRRRPGPAPERRRAALAARGAREDERRLWARLLPCAHPHGQPLGGGGGLPACARVHARLLRCVLRRRRASTGNPRGGPPAGPRAHACAPTRPGARCGPRGVFPDGCRGARGLRDGGPDPRSAGEVGGGAGGRGGPQGWSGGAARSGGDGARRGHDPRHRDLRRWRYRPRERCRRRVGRSARGAGAAQRTRLDRPHGRRCGAPPEPPGERDLLGEQHRRFHRIRRPRRRDPPGARPAGPGRGRRRAPAADARKRGRGRRQPSARRAGGGRWAVPLGAPRGHPWLGHPARRLPRRAGAGGGSPHRP
jgi:hypothetical protein